jgi:hypothetical protein
MALDIPKNKEIFRQRDVRETEPRFTEGEGINISTDKIISGEDATTANKGIASFETNDFAVSGGAVSLKNKTSYWSCSFANFIVNPTSTTAGYEDGGLATTAGGGASAWASVSLPHNAVITSANVTGDAGTWELRNFVPGNWPTTLMASGNIGTADTTITDATINNQTKVYWFVATIGAEQYIYGATITYTTDYD